MVQGQQKINCSVQSCRFNDKQEQQCMLQSIKVAPMPNCDTKDCDESKCDSYEYFEE